MDSQWSVSALACAVAFCLLGPVDSQLARMSWLLHHRVGVAPNEQGASGRLVRHRSRRFGKSVVVERHTGLLAVISELEAGAAPDIAFRAVAARASPELASSLAHIADAVERGDLPSLAESSDRRLGLAVAVALRTGCSVRQVLSGLVAEVESQRSLSAAVRSAVAGPKASATVVATLPVLGVALGGAMDAHPLAVLIGTSAGRILGTVGLALNAAGAAWTRSLIRAAVRT